MSPTGAIVAFVGSIAMIAAIVGFALWLDRCDR